MSTPLTARLRFWAPWVTLALFLGWTVLVAAGLLAPVDRALQGPPLDRAGALWQVLASVGVVFAPVLQYAGLLVLAWWSWRRRLRELAAAIVVATVLAWAGVLGWQVVLAIPRPPEAPDLIGVGRWGYPSGHLAAVATVMVMVTATMITTRQTMSLRRGWWVGGTLVVLAMAADRWGLGALWVSGVVGGLLWGLTASFVALLVCGVHLLPDRPGAPAPADRDDTVAPPRAAVVYNPMKVLDVPTFVRHVEYELEVRGWRRAIFLETTADDPGHAMTATAVRKQVDLVIGAGGDGTVRVIAAGLAGTGIPFAVVAAGTGNLLARNMGIPLDESRALQVAFDGADRPIDLIRVTADDRAPEYSCAFAGVGIDAAIVEADEDLKRAIGSSAYVVQAARHADHPALDTLLSLDGGEPMHTRSHLVLVGNVGLIQAGIQLLPDARPDDGLLDVMVASPRTLRDWAAVVAGVLVRRRRGDDRLTRAAARRVEVLVDPPDRYELDGDPQGTCSRLVAEVAPGALVLRVPR